jgi:hypothetical protein
MRSSLRSTLSACMLPACVVLNARTDTLYVGNTMDGSLTAMDTASDGRPAWRKGVRDSVVRIVRLQGGVVDAP